MIKKVSQIIVLIVIASAVLKLTGAIDISWLIVFSPIWVTLSAFIFIHIGIYIMAAIILKFRK